MNKGLKILNQFYWIAQLGFSLVTPPLLCIWGAIWLQRRFALGAWVVLVGILLGLGATVCSFYSFAKHVQKQADRNKRDRDSFNYHK